MIMNPEDSRRKLADEAEGNIVHTLCNFSQLGCLDERDRVYALASLCKNNVKDFKVDYAISCTYVYRSFAASLVVQRNLSYDLLHIAAFQTGSPKREKGLPSWVPDWRLATPKDHASSSEGFHCAVDRDWRLTATLYIYPVDALLRKGISAVPAERPLQQGDLLCGIPWAPSRHFPQQWTYLTLRPVKNVNSLYLINGLCDMVQRLELSSIRWVAERICIG